MKKIIYIMVSLMFVITSCQQGDEDLSTQNTLSQKLQLEKIFKEMTPSATETLSSEVNKNVLQKECQDCEVTFKYNGISGSTAYIKVEGNTSGVVYDGDVTTGQTYTFPINSCDLYSITVQALTGDDFGHFEFIDANYSLNIDATTIKLTHRPYSFSCPPDVPVDECTITVCLDILSGSASPIYIGVYVNGVFVEYHPVVDGSCFDFTINENNTLEFRLYAPYASSDFLSNINISTPGNRIVIQMLMKGPWSFTGVIPSKYLSCSRDPISTNPDLELGY